MPKDSVPPPPARDLVIRPAVADDAETLLALIRELATFEGADDQVKASAADLRRDGFGTQPRFEALLAEIDQRPAGFALMFPNYSTWEGRAGLFLEDLYVCPWARGGGLGRALIARAAALAVSRGCRRLDLNVLDWNPARGFYQQLGIIQLNTWLPYRLTGAALEALAATVTTD